MLSPQKAQRGRLLLFLALTPGPQGAGGLGAAAWQLSWARGRLPDGPPARRQEGWTGLCARACDLRCFLAHVSNSLFSKMFFLILPMKECVCLYQKLLFFLVQFWRSRYTLEAMTCLLPQVRTRQGHRQVGWTQLSGGPVGRGVCLLTQTCLGPGDQLPPGC